MYLSEDSGTKRENQKTNQTKPKASLTKSFQLSQKIKELIKENYKIQAQKITGKQFYSPSEI